MDVLFKTNDGKLKFESDKEVALFVQGDAPDAEAEKMLYAMMDAIKIDQSKVEIIPWKGTLDRLDEHMKIVILFGLDKASLGNLNLKPNVPLRMEDKVILMTYSVELLMNDRNNKLSLWKILQSTFL